MAMERVKKARGGERGRGASRRKAVFAKMMQYLVVMWVIVAISECFFVYACVCTEVCAISITKAILRRCCDLVLASGKV